MGTHYHSSIKNQYQVTLHARRGFLSRILSKNTPETLVSIVHTCIELSTMPRVTRSNAHTHTRACRFFATGIVAHSSAPCVYKVYACETRHPARGLLPQVDNIGREKIISTRDSRLCFSANYTMKRRLAPVGCNLVTIRTKKERARARRIHVSKYQQLDLSTMHANRIFFFAIDAT